jgi:uncharacterized DUF497 family protein
MFDWDPRKARSKRRNHGVSFEEAATAFLDPDGLDGEDLEHSELEARRLQLGQKPFEQSPTDRVHFKEKKR